MEILNFFKNLLTVAEPAKLLGMFISTFIVLSVVFKDIKLVAKVLTKILIAYSIVLIVINMVIK